MILGYTIQYYAFLLVTCDFELDFCGWTQDQTDEFDWTRDAGGTGSSNTGPSYDHSTGTAEGSFIFNTLNYPGNL